MGWLTSLAVIKWRSLISAPPRLKALSKTREENSTPGATVRSYALKLAADKDTVFAKAIENFIACTKESRETRPQVVMRNMRQFMSGMKNYLVTHGEREFNKEVENERNRVSKMITYSSSMLRNILCQNSYNSHKF